MAMSKIGKGAVESTEGGMPIDSEVVYSLRRNGDDEALDRLGELVRLHHTPIAAEDGAESDEIIGFLLQRNGARSLYEEMYG